MVTMTTLTTTTMAMDTLFIPMFITIVSLANVTASSVTVRSGASITREENATAEGNTTLTSLYTLTIRPGDDML